MGSAAEHVRSGCPGKGDAAASAGRNDGAGLDGLIAHLVASTGCTPQQAWSEWDIPSILAQTEYWRMHPPVHLLVAAQVGYQAPATGDKEDELNADDLLEMFPPA